MSFCKFPTASIRLAIVLLVALPLSAHGQQRSSSAVKKPQAWALLIGVEKYHKASQLQFTVNDVRQIADTLVKYGGYSENCVRQISDEQAEDKYQPLKASLETELTTFLQRPGKDDSIIVYFSGHGFRDDEGKLYLAPLDCDPANPTKTGVSAEWFRSQLEACPAAFKMLVIDACHAGAEKGDAPEAGVPAKDIVALFESSAGVFTLASSKAEEKSQIWQFKKQSLFSYWLKEGFKGHADLNDDAAIDVDEIHNYVHDHVKQTAEIRLRRPQTPVRNIGPRVSGVHKILHLQPQPLKQVVADMAEQIAGLMEERQLAALGVLEFINDTPTGEHLGGEFGLLGKYCAKELERGLLNRSAGKYSVVDQARLQKALNDQRFSLVSFGSAEKLSQLSKSVGSMPVLVKGSLSERNGRLVNLRAKLLETEGDKTLAHVGGLAALSESEWAMLGRSAILTTTDRTPPLDRPIEAVIVDRLDARSTEAHPSLQDGDFRVNLLVNGKIRKPVVKSNAAFVPTKVGEVYELQIEHRLDQIVLARVLVDGLNTLPERTGSKDEKGVETYEVAPRVNLDEARFWILDPAVAGVPKSGGFHQWAFRGFVTNTGKEEGKLREFVIVDADKSIAARKQFTDQIGMITVGLYLPKGVTRGPGQGTGFGKLRDGRLNERDGFKVGNLVGVFHLRYADAETLEKMVRGRD